MENPEDSDTGSPKAENATELKKELERQIKPIIDEDDYDTKPTDEAIRILSSLKELKVKEIEMTNEAIRFVSSSKELKCKVPASYMAVPEKFKCPISREIMGDPVVLVTGQTCDRRSIMELLDEDHWSRPLKKVISYTILSPNHLVREMIAQWCKDHSSIKVPEPLEPIISETVITEADEVCLNLLLEKISSSSISDQKNAARELRRLTTYQPSFQALFVECKDNISRLLEPLVSPASTSSAADLLLDPELQEDLITLLHNVSVHEKNKRPIAETPIVIPSLIERLKTGLTIQTRSNALAALFTLAAVNGNKAIIVNSGALKPLIDLVEEGHPLAMKDLSRMGLWGVLVKKIVEEEGTGPVVVMLLTVLTLLSSQQQAVEELGELGAVPWLLKIMRTTNDETNMVNCAAILLDICKRDNSKRKEMWEAETATGTISRVAVSKNPKASRNGNAILDKLWKSFRFAPMANPEDFDTGPRKAENATELKKELQRQIKPILDEDDYEIKATDEAMRILSSLKELKVKGIEITNETLRFVSSLKELKCKESASYMVVPEEFKCPISGEIMHDPVVLATGQTCDRCSIMEWLDNDHWLCPQTAEVLSYTILSPNHLVREMITQWCKDRSIKLAEPRERIMDESKITEADKVCLFSLLKKMFSSSISDQKRAARELRRLTRYQPSFRALFVESKDAISRSLEPLVSPAGNGSAAHLLLDPELQEDLITLVHNISVHEKNKRPIARNPIVVPLLIETLKTGLTIQTKSNAAASLFTLATFDCNKVIIGNLDVFKPLIDLVEEGHPVAMKDVLLAIYRLCENRENRVKAVQDGAVRVLVKKIMEEEGTGPVVSMLLTVLTLLSSQQKLWRKWGSVVLCLGCSGW
ncbi:unnamed protein product [Camellia sinensis]